MERRGAQNDLNKDCFSGLGTCIEWRAAYGKKDEVDIM